MIKCTFLSTYTIHVLCCSPQKEVAYVFLSKILATPKSAICKKKGIKAPTHIHNVRVVPTRAAYTISNVIILLVNGTH